MSTKQKTRFVVLGRLSWKSMSGYDIKKHVNVGLSHFWYENYGHVDLTLAPLVKRRLATRNRNRPIANENALFTRSLTRGSRCFATGWPSQPKRRYYERGCN